MEGTRGRAQETDWTLVILPKNRWLDIDMREIIRYRDLVWLFVNRDFITVYKQTILGPIWFVIQPLLTTIMYAFVFGNLAKIGTNGILLFYYGGSMLWTYFEQCFKSSSDAFIANAGLFGKVYFPRLTVPISKVFSNMISLAIQFATLMVFFAYYLATGSEVRPQWSIIAFPVLIVWIAAIGTGFGMIVSALTTKYRDLRQLVGFGLNLWMYATPIVYPLSSIPEKYAWVFYVNPVSAPIELFRVMFYGSGMVGPAHIVTSVASTIVVLVLGLLLFNHNERTFIDVA